MQCCNCEAREEPERWRKSWIFVLHGWAIVVGLSGLAFGFTYGLQMDTVFEFLFFYALFNLYVTSVLYMLVVLVVELPVPTTIGKDMLGSL
jgi:hypothetical protein